MCSRTWRACSASRRAALRRPSRPPRPPRGTRRAAPSSRSRPASRRAAARSRRAAGRGRRRRASSAARRSRSAAASPPSRRRAGAGSRPSGRGRAAPASAVTRLPVSLRSRSCSSRSAAHGSCERRRRPRLRALSSALTCVSTFPSDSPQRCDVRVQLGLRQVEERAGALLHRLGRGAPDGARDALVERPALGVELRLGLDRAPLERPRLGSTTAQARRGADAARGARAASATATRRRRCRRRDR